MKLCLILGVLIFSFVAHAQEYLFILETNQKGERDHKFSQCFKSSSYSEKTIHKYYECSQPIAWEAVKACRKKDNRSDRETSAYFYKSQKDCESWRQDAVDGSNS